MSELAEAFDIAGISKSPAIFDIEKLTYFNANYIRNMAPEDFARAAEPFIRQSVKNEAYSASEIAALRKPAAKGSPTSPRRSISSTLSPTTTSRSTRTKSPRPTLRCRSRCCRRFSQSSRR